MIDQTQMFRQLAALERRFDNQIKPVILWSLISETVLTGSVASVTFASIPQHFRSLLIVSQLRSDIVAELDVAQLRFNADAGNNYDDIYLQANNVAVISGIRLARSSIRIGLTEAANSTASSFAPILFFVPGYSGTRLKYAQNVQASVFGDVSAAADVYQELSAGRWRTSNAITSLTLFPLLGTNWVSGSIFQLYGLA